MIRSPQRSYTTQALETWLNRLETDWEKAFREEELEWGRRFYRKAETRSTEVMVESAIVSFRRGKEDVYVVIEWGQNAPQTRQSDPEFGRGRGLAVAGLYELEELLADEISPLPEKPKPNGQTSAAKPGNGRPSPAAPPKSKGPPPPKMHIRLDASQQGVRLEAGWQKDCGKWTRIREVNEVSGGERESLIRLLATFHRIGFEEQSQSGIYYLSRPEAIEDFLKRELPRWEKYFRIHQTPALTSWVKGIQDLSGSLRVESTGEGSRFRWDLRSGEGPVPEGIRRRILAQPGRLHLIPGAGIFRLKETEVDTLKEWKNLLGAEAEGNLPRYMVLSLLGRPEVQMDLSADLDAWRRRVTETDNRLGSLPDYLRPYQKEGITWLSKQLDLGLHPLLADEMGLGKTLQVLNLLQVRGALGKRRILVVCPASVIPVWTREMAAFFPGEETNILGRESRPAEDDGCGFWLASYTQLRRNRHLLDEVEFDYAILDEAQFIKNPDAKVSAACFALKARYRLAMTGTPVENRLLDVWTIFRFLMPGLLGSRSRFEEKLRRNGPVYEEKVRAQVTPFILRRRKAVVSRELPEKTEISLRCPLTPMQSKAYRKIATEGLRDSDGQTSIRAGTHLFALLTRLREACRDPQLVPGYSAGLDQSGKLNVLESRVGEVVDGGSKVVIFSQFTRFLDRIHLLLKEQYPRLPVEMLTGKTRDRNRPVAAFESVDGPAACLVSLRAGGVGINLQCADYVFLMDPWWNPAVEAQAIDRVHRIGQKNPVFVYRLVTEGTIEDKIEVLKSRKSALFDALLEEEREPTSLLEQFDNLQSFIALESP